MSPMETRVHSAPAITVHKEGDEGVLHLDHGHGGITTPIDERPDWAEGLAAGLLDERKSFYEKRLGKESSAYLAIKDAEVIQFDDLSWLGVNEEQEPIQIDANSEYRSEVVAKCLGIDTEEGDLGATTAEIELDTKRQSMSAHERRIFEEAQETGFGAVSEGEAKTGTH